MNEDRFYVCATCGRLKHEGLFQEGACTCDDCYEEGRSEVNWHEADDGDGFVSNDKPRNSRTGGAETEGSE